MDIYVGSRIRLRRQLLSLSQEKLGEAIGLTFQQVQKYERGANRIGAGMLWRIAEVLNVPVSFFFDGFSDRGQSEGAPPTSGRFLGVASTLQDLDEAVADALTGLVEALGRSPHFQRTADGVAERLAARQARRGRRRNTDVPAAAERGEDTGPVDAESASGEIAGIAPSPVEAVAPGAAGQSQSARRPRRRHGAVWDPADIR